MDVYVVLYESFDGDECELCGVFMSKTLAEHKIRDNIAEWGNDDEFRFIRHGDRWVLEHSENQYRIETYKMEISNVDIKEPEYP